ncbi:MAG: fatty acid--CoA ligase family protein [Acidobacteriota bacterium]
MAVLAGASATRPAGDGAQLGGADGADDPPAFLLRTSGTTGAGKWVAVRERQILAVLDAMGAPGHLRHSEGEVVYATPPLSHSYGLSTLFETAKAGGALAFPQGTSPLGPAGDLRAPELAGRVTAIEGVSDFYAQLARLLGRIQLPALRHVGFGGGRMDLDAVERFRATFPGLTYSIRYGLTETPSIVSGATFRPPYDGDWTSSGRVLPVWDLRLVDGGGRPVADGEEGEIELRGPGLAWPYLGESAPDGAYFPTGDLGVLRGGRLSVRGRRSLFIKHGGHRFSPQEVEAVLRRFDGVADVRVSMGGDGLTAEVVVDGGRDAALPEPALRRFAARRLPAYAVPKNLVRRAEIPRTASGKIIRAAPTAAATTPRPTATPSDLTPAPRENNQGR